MSVDLAKVRDVCTGAGFLPWQIELVLFLMWLKDKHPEVDVMMTGPPTRRGHNTLMMTGPPTRRGHNTLMARLRAEYEADVA